MNKTILVLPALALAVAGALWGSDSSRPVAGVSLASSQVASRTMPPSDPKPSGPKKPRHGAGGVVLPQGVA